MINGCLAIQWHSPIRLPPYRKMHIQGNITPKQAIKVKLFIDAMLATAAKQREAKMCKTIDTYLQLTHQNN